MENFTWNELEAFARKEAGFSEAKLVSYATRLCEELAQTGDGANGFMGRFFEKFEVDPSDFDFHRYFLMEGEPSLHSLFRRLVLRRPRSLTRESITLGMLHQAALAKRWDARKLDSRR